MFAQNVQLVNALDYEGDLIGREIMVDAVNHGEWFEEASKGSGLILHEIFRVKSVNRFGCNLYVNFISDRRELGLPVYGPYCGCGEAYRFNVVEPS
jgi:hypothetical protein